MIKPYPSLQDRKIMLKVKIIAEKFGGFKNYL